jgi:hypothetical protein
MNIPQEFEDVFQGVELTEDEIRTLAWVTGWEHRTVENLRSAIQKAQATALPTLQAENEKLQAELENYRKGHCAEGGCAAEKDRDVVLAELEQVKRERDAAVALVHEWEQYGRYLSPMGFTVPPMVSAWFYSARSVGNIWTLQR